MADGDIAIVSIDDELSLAKAAWIVLCGVAIAIVPFAIGGLNGDVYTGFAGKSVDLCIGQKAYHWILLFHLLIESVNRYGHYISQAVGKSLAELVGLPFGSAICTS